MVAPNVPAVFSVGLKHAGSVPMPSSFRNGRRAHLQQREQHSAWMPEGVTKIGVHNQGENSVQCPEERKCRTEIYRQ